MAWTVPCTRGFEGSLWYRLLWGAVEQGRGRGVCVSGKETACSELPGARHSPQPRQSPSTPVIILCPCSTFHAPVAVPRLHARPPDVYSHRRRQCDCRQRHQRVRARVRTAAVGVTRSLRGRAWAVVHTAGHMQCVTCWWCPRQRPSCTKGFLRERISRWGANDGV